MLNVVLLSVRQRGRYVNGRNARPLNKLIHPLTRHRSIKMMSKCPGFTKGELEEYFLFVVSLNGSSNSTCTLNETEIRVRASRRIRNTESPNVFYPTQNLLKHPIDVVFLADARLQSGENRSSKFSKETYTKANPM